jgi:hypothetical protein
MEVTKLLHNPLSVFFRNKKIVRGFHIGEVINLKVTKFSQHNYTSLLNNLLIL